LLCCVGELRRSGIRLFLALANLNFGTTVYVDARTLDTGNNEITLAAGADLSKIA
jgi:hypothetical protein